MNERRQVVGFLFLILLFFMYKTTVWDMYFYGTPGGKTPAATDTPAQTETGNPVTTSSSATTTSPHRSAERIGPLAVNGGPSDTEVQAAGEIAVETDQLRLKVSLLGGRITELRLKQYRERLSKKSVGLNLIQHVDNAPYPLGVYYGSNSDAEVRYNLVGFSKDELKLSGEEAAQLRLEGTLPDGTAITKLLTFYGEGYFIDTDVALGAETATFELEWSRVLDESSGTLLDPYDVTGVVWFDGERADREAFGDLESNNVALGRSFWVSVSDKYFLTSLISPEQARPARVIREGDLSEIRLGGTSGSNNFRLYAGPKSYEMLSTLPYELQRNVDFGYFGFMSAPLLHLLNSLFRVFGNYGLAIISLTVIVRLFIFPLSSTSFKSMKAMQEIQPEVEKIRKKTKDKQQQQMELMNLYKKRGVNPLGGCFPLLLQMPIFFGLFSALRLAVELRHAEFALWIEDLSAAEVFEPFGFNLPLIVVFWVVALMIQQWTTPSPMEPAQKRIMLIMPPVFGFMFAAMPAGLTIYMLVSSLISIAEQRTLRSRGARAAFVANVVTSVSLLVLAMILVKLA